MATNPVVTSNPTLSAEVLPSTTTVRPLTARPVSWGAIIAGLTTAMGLQVLFMMLGTGLGFAMYSPQTSDNPVGDLGTGALVIEGVSAVLSLWFGGWVAGRLTPIGARTTGWLHGFSVWCVSTVVAVILVAAGAGWAIGGLAKVVGGGLAAIGKPAAAAVSGATDLAKDQAQRSDSALSSFVDEAINSRATDQNAPQAGSIRAKREISMAVARLFEPSQQNNMAENRAALVRTMTETTGMTEADANRMVDEWTASYDRLKADLTAMKNDAAAKAKQGAEEASKALTVVSLCAFVAFLMGAFSAIWGGSLGSKQSREAELKVRAEDIAAQDRHYV
ncbi:MAG: hypothetical protein QM790_19055 [Nibricoccus sp.]